MDNSAIRRYLLDTPIGTVSLTFEGPYLAQLSFVDPGARLPGGCSDPGGFRGRDEEFEATRREMDLYFAGRLKRFSVPVNLDRPPFATRVWRALLEIPYAETRTYAQIASLIGSPKAYRAVGNACAANPVAIIVPCHRVVAAEGLGGYGGGLDRKQWLLRHEAKTAQGRVAPL